jgi:GABA permease
MFVPPHRLIVVANRTCPCPGLIEEVAQRTLARSGEVLVVAPALNSRLRHWVSDTDGALAAAAERLRLAVEHLRDAGVHAQGEVGDADPVVAIEDAMTAFPADAVILSTWPDGVSSWLERDLLRRVRERFDVPVEHLVSRYDAPTARLVDAAA